MNKVPSNFICNTSFLRVKKYATLLCWLFVSNFTLVIGTCQILTDALEGGYSCVKDASHYFFISIFCLKYASTITTSWVSIWILDLRFQVVYSQSTFFIKFPRCGKFISQFRMCDKLWIEHFFWSVTAG